MFKQWLSLSVELRWFGGKDWEGNGAPLHFIIFVFALSVHSDVLFF